MVQMVMKDQMEIKRMPGNTICADCDQKTPEWASVTFGTLHCLKCSGIHRSLGVHISFVRSITMDSWTAPQLDSMRKGGGNDNLNNFLCQHSTTVNKTTPIAQKYDSPAAKLYAAKLKARVAGQPEPKNSDYLPAIPSTPAAASSPWGSLATRTPPAPSPITRSHSPQSTMVNFDSFGGSSFGAKPTTTTRKVASPPSSLNSSDFFSSFGA